MGPPGFRSQSSAVGELKQGFRCRRVDEALQLQETVPRRGEHPANRRGARSGDRLRGARDSFREPPRGRRGGRLRRLRARGRPSRFLPCHSYSGRPSERTDTTRDAVNACVSQRHLPQTRKSDQSSARSSLERHSLESHPWCGHRQRALFLIVPDQDDSSRRRRSSSATSRTTANPASGKSASFSHSSPRSPLPQRS